MNGMVKFQLAEVNKKKPKNRGMYNYSVDE
jgi:hypothetical protein